MLRTHATFFETCPDGELLREHLSPATGFRLLRHIASGVYFIESDYITFDTSAFSILETKKVPQFRAIKSTLKSEEKAGRLEWGTYRPSDINDAIWLSDAFQTRVMVAYFDDDGGDMVAIGHCGQLQRACINGSPIDEDGKEHYEIEMLIPEAATYRRVEKELWNDIFEREFKFIFGQAAPDLTDEERPEFKCVHNIQKRAKEKTSLKPLLILTIIATALLIMYQTRPSKPKINPIEGRQKTLQETCAGDLSANMQDICDELQRLDRKSQPQDPK